ncbi:MAG: radical SAM protein, partial [Candidatus Omnitrophica bacterium]|nr:radical SAM protein [Candidatus Omnitrophota bacterium]
GGHRVEVIDAMMERLDFNKTMSRVCSLDIDVIIFLAGSVSCKDDLFFMERVKKEKNNLILIGIGDIFLNKNMFLKNDWIDAVLLDFTTKDILKYIEGDYNNLKNMFYRKGSEIFITQRDRDDLEFEIPLPRQELFLDKRYTFPFVKNLPFATALTDYGCPYKCLFCLYPSLNFKLRNLDNVFIELRYIYSLGVKELFIKDQCFGVNRVRTIKLCEEMCKIGNFSWTCFLRTDIVDLELLTKMKEAGCHTIIFGVESANEEILMRYKPGITRQNIEKAFSLCRSLGISTVGIFILGFPEENKKSCLETIDFSLRLKCDYASYNLFVPKVETAARKYLVANHLLDENGDENFDQSGIAFTWHTKELCEKELSALRRLALAKFYLRPFYVVKRFFNSGSITQLRMLTKSAIFIFKDLIGKCVLKDRDIAEYAKEGKI